MQKKNNFLTKFVKKDYNNRLEEVLSQKDFSEEVKNTLLNIFYKVENGYKDYNTVKKETFEKKEYIEKLINIIDKDCEKIEFVKDDDTEEIVDKDKKKIVCIPIENKILYCLAKIQKRNIVVKYNDESIEEALSFALNTGNNINIVEPLRDFNGFSWNIIEKDIEDLNYNLLYQNIIFLTGNKFADKWVNNYEPLVDYFDLFQSKIEKKYGKKIKESVVKSIVRISLKLKANYDVEFKNEILRKSKELEQKYMEIRDKENYLIKISEIKKQKEKNIKNLDKIMNDKNLLIEEYEKRNNKLPLEKKIFSIRVLKKQLINERENIIKEIENYNNLMNPKYFLENKRILEKKFKYFEKIDELDVQSEIIKLQKDIIRCMYIEMQKIEEKNLELDLDILDYKLCLNEDSIEQVWINILDNAIKFSDKDKSLYITSYLEDNWYVVKFKDEGIGIPDDDLPFVFEKFYKADKSHSEEGNGLGLSLVKRIIELHKGSIEIKSKVGLGTVVIVKLPIDN